MLVALLLHGATDAWAQEFAPIESRDYALDLYTGAALGSVRIVGMGGAAVATAEGSAGSLANPAAPAVRPATSRDEWDWDWHADWLNPELGTDFDNNGIPTEDSSVLPYFTLGGVLQYREWAVALVASTRSGAPRPTDTAGESVSSSLPIARLLVARTFWDDQLAVGAGLRLGSFGLSLERGGTSEDLFSITGAGLEAGAVYRPAMQSWRVGAATALPVSSSNTEVESCDPSDCFGYVLPRRIEVPWQVSFGAAYRFAPTAWNRTVDTPFRDERAILVAADLVVTGAVDGGHGLEAFARRQLQPSGREVAVSARAGVEYEWLPGKLRVRGGSYWEPSRFRAPDGADVPGRLHVTVGVDVRIWAFCFWDDRYRVRLSLLGDGAEGYGNGGLSIGFWH